MNERGPQWCRDNLDLITARLIRSAAKQGNWLAKIPGIAQIGQHTVCRSLVLEAVTLSEAGAHTP